MVEAAGQTKEPVCTFSFRLPDLLRKPRPKADTSRTWSNQHFSQPELARTGKFTLAIVQQFS